MRARILSFLSLLVFCSLADALQFQSSERRIHLIELFSSEGCSSCPPADEWLSSLRKNANLWKEFVPVEFHVDYWNRLGWHDPFSKAAFTSRQNKYASEWGSRNVYTPAFVLNGEEWKSGALGNRQVPKPEGIKVGVLTVTEKKGRIFDVRFRTTRSSAQWMATGALLGNRLSSKVTNGENGGRTLSHEFVAMHLVTMPMIKSGNDYVALLNLGGPLKTEPPSLSLAVWVSDTQSQRPVQAVGGDLSPGSK